MNTNVNKKLELLLFEVANFFQVEPELIKAKTRKREIVMVRQAYHYFARKYLPHIQVSLASIGATTKNDHTTVIHSCKTMDNLIEVDKSWGRKMSELDDYLTQKILHRIKTLRPEEIPANKYQRIKDEKNNAERKLNRMYYIAKKFILDLNEQINEDKVIEGFRRHKLEKEYWEALKKLEDIKLESSERYYS